jgi:cyclopropane fatty-acyl-phospholipid synthase-like methyltransferase
MSGIWDRVYQSDNAFFGDEQSQFATLCLKHMKSNGARNVLEMGAGHGRDTMFFASNGLEVDALEYSNMGIKIINKRARDKKLPVKSQVFDVKKPLPFKDSCFDAVYSHMLLNMRFSLTQLFNFFRDKAHIKTKRIELFFGQKP